MFVKNSVLRNLVILLFTFVFGFTALIWIHILFSDFIENLDFKIKNEQTRYKIGEYILKEINALETNFYKIALTYEKTHVPEIEDEIIEEIIDVNKAVDVLIYGGEIDKYINLNLQNVKKTTEKLIFTKTKDIHYNFDPTVLRPSLANLVKKIYKVQEIFRLKKELLSYTNKKDIEQTRFKIQNLYEQIPDIFKNMKYTASNLLYESKKNLEVLQDEANDEKEYYKKLEFIVSYITMSIVLIFGYLLTKIILIRSKELERITKEAEKSANEASNANKIKSQFLANMSHEIRTPLNAIIGFSEILSKSKLSIDDKEKANVIVKSAKALLDIINDILDISKVESGKLEIQKEKFNLKLLLEQIVELYSINSKQKNIRLIYDLDSNVPKFVEGDETRLKQVLSNLLSNAIKFTPSTSKVTFSVKMQANKHIKFIIKDEGIGISVEDQKKIFEPFSQADGSISRRFGGTGLGLAISLSIVQLMGSKIKLISRKDEGSTFYFDLKLPIIEDEEVNNSEHTHKYNFYLDKLEEDKENTRKNIYNIINEFANIYEDIESTKNVDKLDIIFCFNNTNSISNAIKLKDKYNSTVVLVGETALIDKYETYKDKISYNIDVPIYGSKIFNIVAKSCNIEKIDETTIDEENIAFDAKILVAEDNANNQLLINILLQRLGIDVTIVNNGNEALQEYEKNSYDLVFMDVNMPIMDGITSLKKIREIEKTYNRYTPIIALTANTIKGDKEKYLDDGMDNYLSKPIENKKLLEILTTYLRKKEKPINTLSFDLDLIAQNLGLSEKIALKIVEKFKEEIKKDLEELKHFIDESKNDDIVKKAHYIKNSCLNVSLDDACEILEKIETNNLNNNDLNNLYKELYTIIYERIK